MGSSGHSVDGQSRMIIQPLFCAEGRFRLNTKLEGQKLEPMTDLVRDFSSGVKLIQVSFVYAKVLVTLTSCPAPGGFLLYP